MLKRQDQSLMIVVFSWSVFNPCKTCCTGSLAFLHIHLLLKSKKEGESLLPRTEKFSISLLLISPSALRENISSFCAGRSAALLLLFLFWHFFLCCKEIQQPVKSLLGSTQNKAVRPVEAANCLGQDLFVYSNYVHFLTLMVVLLFTEVKIVYTLGLEYLKTPSLRSEVRSNKNLWMFIIMWRRLWWKFPLNQPLSLYNL